MRTLYKSYSDNCCGVCKLHHVGVTPNQVKRKQCVEKHCKHFRKFNGHEYWEKQKDDPEKKAERKSLRKQRKAAQNDYYENLLLKAKAREPIINDPIEANMKLFHKSHPDWLSTYQYEPTPQTETKIHPKITIGYL